MKKGYFLIVSLLLTAMMAMASCGGTTLAVTDNTGKAMTIEAKKCTAGDFVMTGSLEVEEGEQIVITSNIEKGELKVEIFAEPAEQSAEELPDLESGEPVIVSNASGTETLSAEVPEGSYSVKATSVEKATGTVQIDVTAAGD